MGAPLFFAAPVEFRHWLSVNHDTAVELVVGFYKKGSGRPSLTWSESVDEAICYGWIDGIRRALDAERYTIRFTPRRPTSIWSNVNIAKVEALTREGRMQPSGLAAFARRDPARSGIYLFERDDAPAFTAEEERLLKRNRAAWTYFSAQPPGYRRLATHYVASAKRSATRERRLATLIECSGRGERFTQALSSKGRPRGR